jgi:hypothetical protein
VIVGMFKYLCKLALVAVSTSALISCGSGNTRPDWVDNPGNKHVGKCGTHINPNAQEMCAYKKGLTYLAMTKGVKADLLANMKVSQNSSGKGSSTGTLKVAIQMEGKEIHIKAKIIERWRDRVRDVFYVLMEEE